MTNLEKIKAILGDEVFEKLKENYNSISLSKRKYGINFERFFTDKKFINSAFIWSEAPEGSEYWMDQSNKLIQQWDTFGLRQITQEEQELIFKMFVYEFMGLDYWNFKTTLESFDRSAYPNSMFVVLYDALYCAEGE